MGNEVKKGGGTRRRGGWEEWGEGVASKKSLKGKKQWFILTCIAFPDRFISGFS